VVEVPEHKVASKVEAVPALAGKVTVIKTVDVASDPEHPSVPRTVYVIVEVPPSNALTTPVEELTVATDISDEVQVPPATVEDTVVEVPEHKVASKAEAVPASAAKVSVTVTVAVASEQGATPTTVYV
jgi:hypothetical protein